MRFLVLLIPLLAMAQAHDDINWEALLDISAAVLGEETMGKMKEKFETCLDMNDVNMGQPQDRLKRGVTCIMKALVTDPVLMAKLQGIPWHKIPWSTVFAMGQQAVATVKKEFAGCLNVTPPTEILTIGATCLIEVLLDETNQDLMRKHDFLPDLNCTRKFFTEFKICHWKKVGLDITGPLLDRTALITGTRIKEWTGVDQQIIVDFVDECTTSSVIGEASNSFEQCVRAEQCYINKVIKECQDGAGNILPVMSMMFTLFDKEPKCMGVKVPEEFQTSGDWVTCLEEKRRGLTSNTDFINEIVAAPNMMAKATAFFTHFGTDMVIGLMECHEATLPGFYNKDTRRIVDMEVIAEKVRDFDGYDTFEQGAKMYEAVKSCGDEFLVDESTPGEDETRADSVKKLCERGQRHNRCVFPKVAEICGMNNQQLTNVFMPCGDRGMIGTIRTELLKSGMFMGFEHLMKMAGSGSSTCPT